MEGGCAVASTAGAGAAAARLLVLAGARRPSPGSHPAEDGPVLVVGGGADSGKMSLAPHSRKRVCYYYDSEFFNTFFRLTVVLRMLCIDF
jgi:hypothetical protein